MTQIEELRERYGKIERIDPDGEAYKNLTAYLDNMSTDMLKMLVNAKIKWVSTLAQNRVYWRQRPSNKG